MTVLEADTVTPMEGVLHKLPNRAELNVLINKAQDHPIVIGEKWYVLSNAWWMKIIQAAKQGFVDDVPSIDNSTISESVNGRFYLKAKLGESVDFHLMPQVVFQRLRDSFGIEDEERDVIERTVVEKNGQNVVEVYPRVVTIFLARDCETVHDLLLGPEETMLELQTRALNQLKLCDVEKDKMRFYICHGEKYELIDTTQTDINSYFDTAHKVAVDTCIDGKWFIGDKTATMSYRNGTASTSLYESRDRMSTHPKGACGLQNLGNTCFMASAIHCLSNVPPLTEFFLSNAYLKDINLENPLGTHGELSRAYGELLQTMWSGENSSIYPRKFKTTIGQFAPRFHGYQQQDSQELLAFLLDGLHEDLNRIKKKPYISEEENLENLEEHKQAHRSWQLHKARNDSIIVDKMHGQLRSTLVCPVCNKVSIKFDPFCFLSVPLPAKERLVKQNVILIFNTSRKWANFLLTLTRTTTGEEAIQLIKKQLPNAGDEHMNLVLFTVGEQHDDVTILDQTQPIHNDERFVYAAEVEFPVATSHLVIVKNQLSTGRTVSLPMIFTVPTVEHITRGYLEQKCLAYTRMKYMKTTEVTEKMHPDDDSMNGGEIEEKEEYKIYQVCNGTPMPFPTTNPLEPVSWSDSDQKHTVVFTWKEANIFNNYRGVDLIEREAVIPQRKEIHLTECIDQFTKQEQLGEDDSWYCPKCKKHERASKKLDLWSLPEVLIIHLKRFQYSRWNRDKIDISVTIPVRGFELNSKLANESHEHVRYDLIAISHHIGGLGGGHYTAHALNVTSNKWFDFNDSMVTNMPSPPDPLIGKSPYLLVYRRKNIAPDAALADSNIDMETDG